MTNYRFFLPHEFTKRGSEEERLHVKLIADNLASEWGVEARHYVIIFRIHRKCFITLSQRYSIYRYFSFPPCFHLSFFLLLSNHEEYCDDFSTFASSLSLIFFLQTNPNQRLINKLKTRGEKSTQITVFIRETVEGKRYEKCNAILFSCLCDCSLYNEVCMFSPFVSLLFRWT